MKHYDINHLISQKILGLLTPDEQEALDAWIDRSEDNRQRYESLMDKTDLSERLRMYDSIDRQKAWEKFRDKHFAAQHDGKNRIFRLLRYAVAATVLALIVIGTERYLSRPRPVVAEFTPSEKALIAKSEELGRTGAVVTKPSGETVALTPEIQQMLSEGQPLPKEFFDNAESEATVLTQKGQEFWMTLEDGTRVHLNYNSTLRYPEHFTSDNRTVYLNGEAYFDVAHDSHRPFYVQTENGTIREYGTSFNVNTIAQRGVTQVALVEGSISVTGRNGREHMMSPGQLAYVQGNTGSVRIEATDIQPYVSWNTGEYRFDGCKLEKLMQVLSCWYNLHTEFTDKESMDIEFTGSIDRYKSLQATLNAITFATGRRIVVTDDRITIY